MQVVKVWDSEVMAREVLEDFVPELMADYMERLFTRTQQWLRLNAANLCQLKPDKKAAWGEGSKNLGSKEF